MPAPWLDPEHLDQWLIERCIVGDRLERRWRTVDRREQLRHVASAPPPATFQHDADHGPALPGLQVEGPLTSSPTVPGTNRSACRR